jgi:hypothetical protein
MTSSAWWGLVESVDDLDRDHIVSNSAHSIAGSGYFVRKSIETFQ